MRPKFLIALSACSCLLAASSGLAMTITFDNLAAVSCIPSKTIPNGYDGFDWSNFGYNSGLVAPCSVEGYGTALTSAPNVGFNKNGNPASITSATPFTVQSGVFAAAFNDGLTLFVTGKEGGVAVGTESFLLNTTMPELETFSFGAVTELDFFSLGGTENPSLVQYGSGTEFAVDNLAVTTVPEPSSIVLLSIGLAAVIFWGVGYANRFRSGCRRPEIQGTASEIWTPAPPEDRRPSFTCGELTSAYSSVAIKDPFR